MDHQTKGFIVLFVAISGFAFLAGMTCMEPKLPKCQVMVMEDLKAHQIYSAQMSKLVAPDFLETLKAGR